MKNSKKKYIKIFKLPEEKTLCKFAWNFRETEPATKKKRSVELQLYINTLTQTHTARNRKT